MMVPRCMEVDIMSKNAKMKYKFKTELVPGLPKYKYSTPDDKPLAVGLHWVGNYKSYKAGEIAWMSRNWNSAFVHAFVDHTGVTEVANTDYLCWGIGPKGNSWMVQIEMVHSDTREQFFKCLDHYLFWAAYQHYYYDMGRKVDNAETDGWGTIWTHNAVSRHLGGTDHVDPMDYISKWGVTLNQMVAKIQDYVTALYAGDSTHVAAIGEGTEIKTVDKIVKVPKPTTPSVKKAPPVPKVTPKSVVPNSYRVKSGETLHSIAEKYHLDVADIVKYNPNLVEDFTKIPVGQFLYLKPQKKKEVAKTYTVKSGDTLWGIAQKYDVDVYALEKLNGLRGKFIKVGDKIKIII